MIRRARRIIAAHEQARAGQGVVVVDGRLVEHLHVVEARRQAAPRRGDRGDAR